MKLLVLGGTKFLGRGVVEAALAAGHDVTLFNRGQTNPEDFPETEKLRGDLTGDLDALQGREWDAAIDLDPTQLPRHTRRRAEALAGSVGHYVFVSTISVYSDPSTPIDEGSPLFEPPDPEPEAFDPEHPAGMIRYATTERDAGLSGPCPDVDGLHAAGNRCQLFPVGRVGQEAVEQPRVVPAAGQDELQEGDGLPPPPLAALARPRTRGFRPSQFVGKGVDVPPLQPSQEGRGVIPPPQYGPVTLLVPGRRLRGGRRDAPQLWRRSSPADFDLARARHG